MQLLKTAQVPEQFAFDFLKWGTRLLSDPFKMGWNNILTPLPLHSFPHGHIKQHFQTNIRLQHTDQDRGTWRPQWIRTRQSAHSENTTGSLLSACGAEVDIAIQNVRKSWIPPSHLLVVRYRLKDGETPQPGAATMWRSRRSVANSKH
jgi:hypothetical protein